MDASRTPTASLPLATALLLSPAFLGADDLTITSFGTNGVLTFSCPAPHLSYRVGMGRGPRRSVVVFLG